MQPTTVAYYAGFFDGEGCVVIKKQKRKRTYYLSVTIGLADGWDVLYELREKYGGGLCIGSPQNPSQKLVWEICCNKALKFLEDIYPFSRIKRKQIATAIGFQKHRKFTFKRNDPEYIEKHLRRRRWYKKRLQILKREHLKPAMLQNMEES